MNVRINSDDTKVCSVGGKDWAMFQFKFVRLDPEPPPPPPPTTVWGPLDSTGESKQGLTSRVLMLYAGQLLV